jgi:hypothetical protein
MKNVQGKQKMSATLGMLILLGGLSGCSMFSPSSAPVDCDVVKTQARAGKSDTQIASDLGAPVDKIAECHGPEATGNKSEEMIPSSY